MASDERYEGSTRRQFLRSVGGSAGALLLARTGYAHHHGKPMPQSTPTLDQKQYLHNMEIVAHVPGVKPGAGRGAGEMMAIGRQRLLLSSGDLIDVSDPRKPQVFQQGGVPGGELAYNAKLKKWLIMQSREAPHGMYTKPFGKYEIPNPTKVFRDFKGFRGVQVFDVTNPAKIDQLGEFNTGPTGMGAHGEAFYDGGKYAYIAAAPDDSFVNQLSCIHPLSHCMVILDFSDPAKIREVSRWWVPGQRAGEIEELKKWQVVDGRANDLPNRTMTLEETIEAFKTIVPRFPAPDRMPYTNFHNPIYVPKRVEDGGTIGYGAWSAFGMLIHDLTDITKPKLIGKYDPSPTHGIDGIPFHTIWPGTLPRGFVVSVSEALNPDCNESWLPNWVIDVRDPTRPVPLAQLPRPLAPPDAPFADFCFRRGRFSAHKPPLLNAPGRIKESFLPLEYFNAGVRCYDLSDPKQPKEVAYFVPPMGSSLSPECTVPAVELEGEVQQRCMEESNTFVRPSNSVYVEWDRNLIYAGTTTGLYILSTPALGKPVLEPMAVSEWSLPHLNQGAP